MISHGFVSPLWWLLFLSGNESNVKSCQITASVDLCREVCCQLGAEAVEDDVSQPDGRLPDVHSS